ncbi:MAG: CPBP family intramembrane metalloprotease [Planctomycetia bacterium]|nr:CPBP family intramembrane metalloprotease [Planctomycetia bacterium]
MISSAYRARRGLLIYLGVLAAGSSLFEGLLLRAGDSIRNHVELVLPLMWMPAVAAVVARLVLRDGFKDVSFRWGGRRGFQMAITGWLFPVAVGTVAYGLAWSTGLALFKTPAVPGLPAVTAPIDALCLLLAIRLSIGVVIAAIAAAGEEIGWRGYMLSRLIEAGVPCPIFVSGLVWAAWHLPLILGGVYASGPYPILSACLFVVAIVAQGFVLARLRLASGSVWPAIIGHSAWNATIQGVFDFSTISPSSGPWVGESGILVALTMFAFAWPFMRGTWPAYRAPGVPLVRTAA